MTQGVTQSDGSVVAAIVVLGQHNGVQTTYIDCSLLIAADVSQPIQKMIGIGWLRSADINNLIFCIGYPISHRLPWRHRRLPQRRRRTVATSLGDACRTIATSLDATPSPPSTPTPHHRRLPWCNLPQHRAAAASTSPSTSTIPDLSTWARRLPPVTHSPAGTWKQGRP
jgi:hypothetical protein